MITNQREIAGAPTEPQRPTSVAEERRRRAETILSNRVDRSSQRIGTLPPAAVQELMHELSVHEIELELQNEELRRVQLELEASRALYVDLYELAPVGYCTVGDSGLILQANLTAASLLRVPRGALIKQALSRFILMEDQIAVGDVVDVGKEHAGVVEAISVRTIRLRDQAGAVHTVPFSEVTSVKNLTRDFAYAVARITIPIGEDIDRVVEILHEVSEELMADATLRPLILDPFDYQGVDTFDAVSGSVVLLVRIRTIAGKQWVVGRAFNRLVKIAFDKHGIRPPEPAPTTIVVQPGYSDRAATEDATLQRRRA